nr:uncharacterized protein LOC101884708 isoform X3 [Danio rerio]|eukprot:XP_021331391.1 uncharacterized protein LOC101884708 isoform X3 [Danio rerio]
MAHQPRKTRFVKWVKRQSSRPGTKMELFQKYIRRRDAEMLPGSAPPVAASSSAPEEEPSDEALLAVVSHMDVSAAFSWMVLEAVS